MQHERWARASLAALAVVGLATACSGDDGADDGNGRDRPRATITTSTTMADSPTRIEITVANGSVAGGVRTVRVGLGDEVTLVVTSDVADEVHLHGYDLAVDVTPGAPAEITFVADIPGVFEAELESRGFRIVEVRVQ